MPETPIIIVGAGRHGLELGSYLHCCGREQPFRLIGYVDENKPRGSNWGSSQILGDINHLLQYLNSHREGVFHYITAVGMNQARRHLVSKLENLITAKGCSNLKATSILHPFSFVGTGVEIGHGTCLAPGSIVTTQVKIGRHVILNTKVSVSHDCVIGDYVNLNPGVTVCGNVNIEEGCYIGAGATVVNGIKIGEWSVVGAGATVIRDVPARVTVAGVPAQIIKKHLDCR